MIDVPDIVIVGIVLVGAAIFAYISVNVGVTPVAPYDEEVARLFDASRSMTKQERREIFLKLSKMSYQEIYELMIAKGWKPESADMLANTLTKVMDG